MSLAPWGYTLLATGALPQVLPTREQEGFTLGFHIVLVPFGVASTSSCCCSRSERSRERSLR